MECMKAFNLETKEIRKTKGNVVAKLDLVSIAIVFILPFRDQFTEVDKECANSYFINNEAHCLNNIVRKWLAKPRKGKTHLPKIIDRSLLMEDIANMVIFVNHVTRNEDSNNLEGWMFLFINIVYEGIQFINWAEIISNNLCDQLLKLRKNYNFYMTS